MKPLNLVGRTFVRLTVVERAGTHRQKSTWRVRCECGNERVVPGAALVSGNTKSCGCLQRDRASMVSRTPGLARPAKSYPEYTVWCAMVQRCTNCKDDAFINYGGRGIKVCDRWRNSFADFLADMGERPSAAHSIERLNNDGHYEPNNVLWATVVRQANNKRSNVRVAYLGRTQTVAEWCRELGLRPFTVYNRLNHCGWSPERALTTPCLGRGRWRSSRENPATEPLRKR